MTYLWTNRAMHIQIYFFVPCYRLSVSGTDEFHRAASFVKVSFILYFDIPQTFCGLLVPPCLSTRMSFPSKMFRWYLYI